MANSAAVAVIAPRVFDDDGIGRDGRVTRSVVPDATKGTDELASFVSSFTSLWLNSYIHGSERRMSFKPLDGADAWSLKLQGLTPVAVKPLRFACAANLQLRPRDNTVYSTLQSALHSLYAIRQLLAKTSSCEEGGHGGGLDSRLFLRRTGRAVRVSATLIVAYH